MTTTTPGTTPGTTTGTATRCLPPINFNAWVQEHKHLLKPPVGNHYMYDGDDFFVMVIGGPNARNDFHLTDSEEFFFQIKGDILITVIEDGKRRDVPVREGETFFIPGGVPHSPQRPPDTIGMVVERRRPAGETEHQQFYCKSCHQLVFDREFDCKDIVEHFAQSMEDYWADKELCTCKNCGTHNGKPTPIKRIIFEPEIVVEHE